MNATFSEQIHLYYEGLLPEYAEARLFAELSQNSDLRSEMNMQLKLLNAVKSHAAAIQPPPNAKEILFARLGLKLPSGSPSNLAATNTLRNPAMHGAGMQIPANGVQSSLSALAISLCSSLTTVAIILLLIQSGWMFGTGGRSNVGNGIPPPTQGVTMLPASFDNAAFVPRDTVRETRIQTQTIVRYLPNNQAATREAMPRSEFSPESQTILPAFETHNQTNAIADTLPNILPDKSVAADTQAIVNSSETIPTQEEPRVTTPILDRDEQNESNIIAAIPSQKQHSPIGIIVGVRGVRSRSFPEATVASGSYSIFNNTAFSLMIPLSPSSAIGVETGQEAYFLRYRTQLPEQEYLVDMEKNPVLLWAGLTYRHTFLPNELFSPFVNVTLGGVSIGAMGRTLFGLQYALDTRTRCMLGVEASSLLYIHRGTWNFSPNLGISYGISVEL